jgi:hypothetical protein
MGALSRGCIDLSHRAQLQLRAVHVRWSAAQVPVAYRPTHHHQRQTAEADTREERAGPADLRIGVVTCWPVPKRFPVKILVSSAKVRGLEGGCGSERVRVDGWCE